MLRLIYGQGRRASSHINAVRAAAATAASATAAVAAIACAEPAAPAAPAALRAAMLEELRRESESEVHVENWSGTHDAKPASYFSPITRHALQNILNIMQMAGSRLRVVGSALSPNGLGLSDEAMMSMSQMDAVLHVDKEKLQVRVQAGARVSEVVEALRPHGLTLQNYASIAEQQVGGFVQAGAHGTGATIPPVDEQVVSFSLHTPAMGELKLSAETCPRLFYLTRVGLGWLGVVSEVTLQCVPAHKLLQHTFVETRAGVARRHNEFLAHKHMRYMWIPHTDTVVVVTCDPIQDGEPVPEKAPPKYVMDWKALGLPAPPPEYSAPERPLRELLVKKARAVGEAVDEASIQSMNFAQLRDALIALAPLDKAHVIEINKAEAKFWRASEGYRVDWSDKILGFECGGQQWVSEVAMPCGTIAAPNGRDLEYMTELLAMVEQSEIAAPSPIEQRWTRRSRSVMSPAHSEGDDDLHSWVGIIMYLPTDEPTQRAAITEKFWEYNKMCRDQLWPKYTCHQHWAKIEPPSTDEELEVMRERLKARFPLKELWMTKQKVDPKGVLGNSMIDTLLLPNDELAARVNKEDVSEDATKSKGFFLARGWF